VFPILGGRLLKVGRVSKILEEHIVSNPWREAIEDEIETQSSFVEVVSNPWREAIEAIDVDWEEHTGTVSNPWREAIEGKVYKK